jgi:hypothetical protein
MVEKFAKVFNMKIAPMLLLMTQKHQTSQARYLLFTVYSAGVSSLAGVPGVSWHTQILADQLTLFQSGGGGTDYAHLISTGTPGFSELPTALQCIVYHMIWGWQISKRGIQH